MKALNKLTVAVLACALAGMGMVGCNTFKGAGKDIQKGGEAIENAADGAQSRLEYQEVQQYSITALAMPGGTISPSGSTSALTGSNRTFTIAARSGYHIEDVLVDGKSVGPVSSHTFNDVRAAHSISALFASSPTS